ncbi:MAG TPA: ABC transporter substrate-binding protein [Alphaproteobacteria bacterium]|nr:ABC transporter substrate-binding protein [Alphaproteobacteria bacterium]
MKWHIAVLAALFVSASAHAAEKLKVVATFSILGDIVQTIGGEKVDVKIIVGPNEDAHVYEPTPNDARALAEARLVFVNGLNFEGWIDRLINASGTKGKVVVASKGVKVRRIPRGRDGTHDHGRQHDHGQVDPHAWQNLENGAIYVQNAADALIAADPANAAYYRANARGYSASLILMHSAMVAKFKAIPGARRKIVTSHDAFGYFADAYGLTFLAPEGLSTEGEPSAADVVNIITQIRRDRITAVFIENMSSRRIVDQIARETGAKVGGTLYADALSGKDGPASSYVKIFEHNSRQLLNALSPGS